MSRGSLELVYGELFLGLPQHLAPPVSLSLPHRHRDRSSGSAREVKWAWDGQTNRAFFIKNC